MLLKLIAVSVLSIGVATSAMAQASGGTGGTGGTSGSGQSGGASGSGSMSDSGSGTSTSGTGASDKDKDSTGKQELFRLHSGPSQRCRRQLPVKSGSPKKPRGQLCGVFVPFLQLRFHKTDFTYERERQPLPRIGARKAEMERFLTAMRASRRVNIRIRQDVARSRIA
ncbi:hypothetical protein [Rhizobium gallicum]|uniref:hypothetical protein n=1 Tax=Rhizobium gallicum TaxID=56730 RepID=UPI001EF7C435|nr:hypothetical protein [Rhizobium gallicum]ULJ72566.1 hypothetical protein L2W42_02345 [Rhizobium gallicum]